MARFAGPPASCLLMRFARGTPPGAPIPGQNPAAGTGLFGPPNRGTPSASTAIGSATSGTLPGAPQGAASAWRVSAARMSRLWRRARPARAGAGRAWCRTTVPMPRVCSAGTRHADIMPGRGRPAGLYTSSPSVFSAPFVTSAGLHGLAGWMPIPCPRMLRAWIPSRWRRIRGLPCIPPSPRRICAPSTARPTPRPASCRDTAPSRGHSRCDPARSNSCWRRFPCLWLQLRMRPSLVFASLRMPGFDGTEAAATHQGAQPGHTAARIAPLTKKSARSGRGPCPTSVKGSPHHPRRAKRDYHACTSGKQCCGSESMRIMV